MKKTNNIWGNTSNFLKIMIISLIFVGCSATGGTTTGGDTGGGDTEIASYTTLTTDAVKGMAGITAFTITDFANVNAGEIAFHADDKVSVDTKKLAVKKAFDKMFERSHVGVTIIVNDDVTFDNGAKTGFGTVTFTPVAGYVFADKTVDPKTATISFANNYEYFIKTADDLMALSGQVIIEKILFMNDIDMTGKTFKGIAEFTGIMDGNGKKIKNLTIKSAGAPTDGGVYAGLILKVLDNTTVEIKNLTIESGTMSATGGNYSYAGAFIADNKGTVTLTGLINKATLSGDYSGGMIGNAIGSVTIKNAENTGAIDGDNAGGVIGLAGGTVTINNAKNTGTIKGATTGGMIGKTYGTVTINTSHSYQAQKLVGAGTATSVTASYYLTGGDGTGSGGTELTAAEFKNQANFANWNFTDIWVMGTAHPELR